jgi:hypothetical protein
LEQLMPMVYAQWQAQAQRYMRGDWRLALARARIARELRGNESPSA